MPFTLFSATVVAIFFAVVSGQNATVVTGNPLGASYLATLPDIVSANIRGSVLASSDPSGTGVLFQVSFSGFPDEGGPFLYHVHNYPITDGNFSTAGGHLDPFLRGDSPSCDAGLPATCQVGDLSGKHGKINGTTFSANYVDDYVSTEPGTPAFMGNRSVIVHYGNKTIITGASFVLATNGTNATSSMNSSASSSAASGSSTHATLTFTAKSTGSTGIATGTAAASPSSSTGGADKFAMNIAAVMVGVGALLF